MPLFHLIHDFSILRTIAFGKPLTKTGIAQTLPQKGMMPSFSRQLLVFILPDSMTSPDNRNRITSKKEANIGAVDP